MDAEKPGRVVIESLRLISWIYYYLGDHPNALDYSLKAVALARAGGYRLQQASVLDALAMIHAASGDVDQALNEHEEALQLAREVNDEVLEAIVMNNNAYVLLEQKEYARALERGMKSWELVRRLNLNKQRSDVADTLAQILQQMGEPARAEQLMLETLAIDRETQQDLGQAYTLLNLGGLRFSQRDFARAEVDFLQALEVAARIGARPIQMDSYHSLARVAEQKGDWQRAFTYHKAFHEFYKELHNERTSQRMSILKVAHQVETAKRDAEIYHLRNEELLREIEERKRVEQALQELAITDPLTGLHNRRHFFNLAEALFNQAVRYQRPLSIIILDIDRFKQVNDTYGHLVGDQAIRHLADAIRHSIRLADVTARFGGDEFVILLPESDLPHALGAAERMRDYVATYPICVAEASFHVTLSIGVATMQYSGETMDLLLEQADRALYAAKNNGRNQVQTYRAF